ncbi:MAG TPA: metallophosphoesterase, partial [Thermomicrobiales bacterium]|nr:metallophosphoesterase [Thermomicrobiales bacterium]
MTQIGVLWAMLLAGAFIIAFGGFVALEPVDHTPAVEMSLTGQGERIAAQLRRQPPVLIAAGDIAHCGSRGDEATAALVRNIAGTVATLGDHAYETGSMQDFSQCYDPTWGSEKERTRPAAGNHEYATRDAKAYFDYFGQAAGNRGEGYYSYDLGAWHIVVLNSNCDQIGGCESDSPQGRWLREDLADHPATCTLAYWHHPLFSSGKAHGGDDAMRPFWDVLYDAGADVVLSAHEHHYERFAPQDPAGHLDRKHGIRQFVVGTGGGSRYGFGRILETSEVRNAETFGVLELTLHRASYDW